ncbi:MAG TPA: VWA domain-containing protein [Terriglobales bacterium]|nr:VWA domain-containing protein [Terriglobales bacterium]
MKKTRAIFLPALLLLLVLGAFAPCINAQQPGPAPSAAAPTPAPQSVPGQAAPLQNQQAPPPIQVTTGLVHLVATVTDRRHNFVTTLDQSDFKVFENGTPQEIRFFGRETDLPLRIALLLDTSNSIRPRLEFEQDAAVDFLNSVIRRDKDMAFLMTFDNEPEVIQDYTGDLALLTKAIRKQRAGGGTALNDAIYRAAEKLSNPPLPPGANPEVRRVLVVISDGEDNLSDRALSDAIEAAIRAEASIYAISTNTDWISISDRDDSKKESPEGKDKAISRKLHLDRGDKVLQQFAEQSGGRVFFPYRVDDLEQSFVDIGSELRSQYFIAYSPTAALVNGQYRKIEVDTDRKNLTVRTRKGYYASAPSSPLPANNK